ncbi:MAG TPA: histidine kinase dimerization/phosphoacceptor domain -containing protein [Polyangiaceae bacterium]|nr:histidine kinase dimerization/phosphoacceptor domain -containing protein [Polyangiaceae bacterium]
MHAVAFHALLVEENPAERFLAELLASNALLDDRLGAFKVERVAHIDDALLALRRGGYDVILLEVPNPNDRGLQTFRSVQDVAGSAPIVVLTERPDAEFALQALTLGAQDILSKRGLGGEMLTRTLRYAIERRRAQRQLLGALREKDVLLRELHHRAKNNLQVVGSLLSMQARRSNDDRFKALVNAARERIDSIALAHDQLHSSPDLARIDFSAYLTKLAIAVHGSHGGASRNIHLNLQVGSFALPLDQAVSAGLIVNELLTNALKHAFPDEGPGNILLMLTRQEDRFLLCVEDDGIGVNASRPTTSRPLGLELVATLLEQLDARMQQEATEGTSYRVTFPARSE